jgi:hypothetical protein
MIELLASHTFEHVEWWIYVLLIGPWVIVALLVLRLLLNLDKAADFWMKVGAEAQHNIKSRWQRAQDEVSKESESSYKLPPPSSFKKSKS